MLRSGNREMIDQITCNEGIRYLFEDKNQFLIKQEISSAGASMFKVPLILLSKPDYTITASLQ